MTPGVRLEARPYVQARGLAVLSLILAAVPVGLGGEVLSGLSFVAVLLLACVTMLAAVATVTMRIATCRSWGSSSGSLPTS